VTAPRGRDRDASVRGSLRRAILWVMRCLDHDRSIRPFAAPLAGTVALATALATALALGHSPAAHACGGMVFPAHEERAGGMSDQELLLAFGDDETVLVASAGYEGVDAADFAFLLPLASNPAEVRDADPALFIALDEHTAPRVSIHLDEGEPSGGGCGARAGGPPGDANEQGFGDEGEVMVHQRGQTATYEYVVIGGDTGSAVADWLTDEGYPLPADYATAIEPYVSDGRFFFAAKVLPEAAAGALAPIELHLPASPPEAFEIPLALAAHSLAPDQPLRITTYLWADGALLPEGYAADAIDESELVALSDSESNYAELERAVLDSDPEGAWIIDASRAIDAAELEYAYEEALGAGRADPATSNGAFVRDFVGRLSLGSGQLTRIRTELRADQLRDMPLRRSAGTNVTNHHDVTFTEDAEESEGCAIDRSNRLGILLLVPVLALLRPRRRRIAA
jgi:hypothetical protein